MVAPTRPDLVRPRSKKTWRRRQADRPPMPTPRKRTAGLRSARVAKPRLRRSSLTRKSLEVGQTRGAVGRVRGLPLQMYGDSCTDSLKGLSHVQDHRCDRIRRRHGARGCCGLGSNRYVVVIRLLRLRAPGSDSIPHAVRPQLEPLQPEQGAGASRGQVDAAALLRSLPDILTRRTPLRLFSEPCRSPRVKWTAKRGL